jgi:hypothetical protein
MKKYGDKTLVILINRLLQVSKNIERGPSVWLTRFSVLWISGLDRLVEILRKDKVHGPLRDRGQESIC